jgi:hypothetical protein
MRKLLALLLILALPALLVAQANAATQSKPLIFTHVTVIDMTGAPAKPDMTVVVDGGRISALGKSGKVRIPKGAQVINAAGKFMIPGLWDMHVHSGSYQAGNYQDGRKFLQVLVPCKISFRLHLLVVAAQVFSCLRDGELPLDFDA